MCQVPGAERISLQVFLAKAGICSRRKAEKLIKEARVKVNGITVTQAFYKIHREKDQVVFDGKRVNLSPKVYLLLNKPRGVTTTRYDPHAKRNVLNLLPEKYRHLHPVGRLDKNTQGLLLLTNDGELTFRLTHPKFGVEKTYLVRLDKVIEARHCARLARGILLEDGPTLPCKMKAPGPKILEITIRQGKKRQIRRMFGALGYKVLELTRTHEAGFRLGNIAPGKFRVLSESEIRRLYSYAGLRL